MYVCLYVCSGVRRNVSDVNVSQGSVQTTAMPWSSDGSSVITFLNTNLGPIDWWWWGGGS